MSQLTITCPSCNETFSADQALQNHLKTKELKFQEEIKVKEKLLKEKFNLDLKLKEKSIEKQLLQKVQDQNKVKLQALQSKVLEAEKSKKETESKMINDLKQKEKIIEKQYKDKEKALENKQKDKFKELQNKVLEAEKNKKEAEKKLIADMKQKEKNIEYKLKEKSENEIQKFKDLIAKKDKEIEIQNKRQQAKIDDMAKQLKQKSVEVQGEVQEELIEDYLRNKFPNDTVEEVKKGAKGADCILSINHKNNEKLAQIYFESKDHKYFKEEWVAKLLNDMKNKSINYGILVTTAMPKDYRKQEDGFVERHGKRILIVPMNYQIIHTLVTFIRTNLITEYKSKKNFNAPKALQRLWDHITGPSFQLPLRNLYQTMVKMNDLISKEKKFFENSIVNKERAMLDMEEEFRDMIKSFTLNVGNNILPDSIIKLEE